MTNTIKKAIFERVLCIWYPVWFCLKNNKDEDKDVRALIDSDRKVNTIYYVYATKLGLCTRKINVGVQKIDKSHLDTFGIIIADFSVKDKLGRIRFF